MALVDELRPGAAVALDTDSIIYYVEQHPRYLPAVEPLIELIRSGSLQAHLSIITLLEVLVLPLRNGRQDLVGTYRDVLLRSPWLTLHPVTVNIAERAAGIRASSRVEVADSIVASTALTNNCEYLITNNGDDFRKVEGLNVLTIDEHL